MGETDSDKPSSSEPSLEDLLKSDDFQNRLEAARAKRAQIQAERAKSGEPRKLRSIRPGAGPPEKPPAPMVLETAQRVERPSATIIPLTAGMRVQAADSPALASDPEPPQVQAPALGPAAASPAPPAAAPSITVPARRTVLTSIAGIVIGFAAGAIAMNLLGREVNLPLPSVFGGESVEVGAIRPTRDFKVTTEAPAPAEASSPADAAELAATAPAFEVPDAPPAAEGAERPDLSTDPPEPPFAELAAESRVAIFAAEGVPADDLTERLAGLGVTDIETRSAALATDGIAIRFYREEDASLARGLAVFLDASLQDLTSFRPLPEEPRIEIWVGET